MKRLGKSPARNLNAAAFSSPVRTGEVITKSGTWRSECAREGCRAVEHLSLRMAAPAPPCIRCCNPTTLYFVRPSDPVANETREGSIAGPRHFSTRLTSARFGQITLTWPRDSVPGGGS